MEAMVKPQVQAEMQKTGGAEMKGKGKGGGSRCRGDSNASGGGVKAS